MTLKNVHESARLTEERLSPVYQIWGMREQARSAYEMALAFDPTNADAHAALGGLDADAGDWDRAVSHYQKAVAIEPAHARANYDLGYLHARRRQWQAAETALSQAVNDKRFGANVHYKFGAEMRPRLDGSGAPFDLQLSEDEIRAIEGADAQMREERKRQDKAERTDPPRCGGGRFSFHIDAYGRLGLCSNNRRQGHDLRTGSFREGFYELLPRFPCPLRQGPA